MRQLSIFLVGLFCFTSLYAGDIDFSGDVRLRHEVIDDSTSTNQATRQRVRARLNAEAKVSETTTVGLGVATGSTTDRRSTNQTLSGSFTSKSINLDTAYISTQVLGVDVTLGKFKNTLTTQSELFWDSDVRPEGVSASYDALGLSFTGAYLVLEDNATDDSGLAVGQVSYGSDLFDLSASYTASVNTATNDKYLNVNGALKGGQVFGLGLALFGEYNLNTEATNADTAWLAGLRTSFKGVGISYAYRNVEANSVNSLLTDSDFGNGVDAKGSEVSLSYQYDAVKVGATYFDLTNGLAGGTDYDRLQVDLSVSF